MGFPGLYVLPSYEIKMFTLTKMAYSKLIPFIGKKNEFRSTIDDLNTSDDRRRLHNYKTPVSLTLHIK